MQRVRGQEFSLPRMECNKNRPRPDFNYLYAKSELFARGNTTFDQKKTGPSYIGENVYISTHFVWPKK
jgi:hypothetical protein